MPYPLDVKLDSNYQVMDVKLEDGDRVVFCSDDIVEAGIPSEEMFGFQRTSETIRALCAQRGSSSEEIIDGLLGQVNAFTGDCVVSDDMTCVVVAVA